MVLKQYDYFGERALLNDAPRAASVKATSPMKLLQISKSHFEEVLGSLEEIIDSHRRKREESARRAYLQRQAEGLLDASAQEFISVAKLAQWRVSVNLMRLLLCTVSLRAGGFMCVESTEHHSSSVPQRSANAACTVGHCRMSHWPCD